MSPFLLVVHTSRRRLKGHGNQLPRPWRDGGRAAPRTARWSSTADGISIRRWRTAWRTACQAAGVPTRFLHDCRRTAARNLIRASVPERVAMLLTGHKTRVIFGRDNIIQEQELLEAGDQLVTYLAQHAQATPRGLNPGFSEKIGNSRRTGSTELFQRKNSGNSERNNTRRSSGSRTSGYQSWCHFRRSHMCVPTIARAHEHLVAALNGTTILWAPRLKRASHEGLNAFCSAPLRGR